MKKTSDPASKKTITKKSPARVAPTVDIEVSAYFIYLKRQKNGNDGDPLSDWVEAERQLQAAEGGSMS